MKKLCIDLFSGLGGWSEAFMNRPDWNVVRIENNKRFKNVPHTVIMDVLDFDVSIIESPVTVVLASPPCTTMSVASVRWYWGHIEGYDGAVPGKTAREHIALFQKTLDIIHESQAPYYAIENPMGMAKHIMGEKDHRTYHCIWKDPDPVTGKLPPMKPTDLWYHLPPPVSVSWPPLIPDTWEKAPRGARSGTQGIKDKAERAKIPYRLSEFIRMHIDAYWGDGMGIDPAPWRYLLNDFADVPIPEGKK